MRLVGIIGVLGENSQSQTAIPRAVRQYRIADTHYDQLRHGLLEAHLPGSFHDGPKLSVRVHRVENRVPYVRLGVISWKPTPKTKNPRHARSHGEGRIADEGGDFIGAEARARAEGHGKMARLYRSGPSGWQWKAHQISPAAASDAPATRPRRTSSYWLRRCPFGLPRAASSHILPPPSQRQRSETRE